MQSGESSLGLGKPFLSQNSVPCSSRAMVGFPHPMHSDTGKGQPQGSQQNATRPPSVWQNAQHAFLLTRESRQIFVGTRFRNLGIRWNWAKCWILKEKEKLQALDWCPGWNNWVTYIHACLYILTCVYVYVHIFISYFIICNVQTYNSYTPGGGFKQGLRESEDFAPWALNSVLDNLNRKRP